MFGGITDLPQLRSFEQALEHYESIKPIRGSNNLRPICATTNGRRKKHIHIIKRDDAIASAVRYRRADFPYGEVVGGWSN